MRRIAIVRHVQDHRQPLLAGHLLMMAMAPTVAVAGDILSDMTHTNPLEVVEAEAVLRHRTMIAIMYVLPHRIVYVVVALLRV
jgi:hypothetical protein